MNNTINLILTERIYGTHNFLDVLCNDFKILRVFILFILFFIGAFISKKISKKMFKLNKVIYLMLIMFYITISLVKAFNMSRLAPHDLTKDFCDLGYSVIQIISIYHIPIIYIIIILAKLIDKKIKDKRRDNK